MIEPTPNPRVFKLRLTGWDKNQPDVSHGTGTRAEIHCSVEFGETGTVTVQYLGTEYYQRETPVLPWRHTGSVRTPQQAPLGDIIRAQVWMELLEVFKLEVVWPS